MNIISFCLYGSNKKYTHGILEAIVSYKLLFLEWDIWVYISSKTINNKLVAIIKNLGCTVIIQEEQGDMYEEYGTGTNENNEPMFWRFTPMYNSDINYFISRDADSRASIREKTFVDEFIKSDKAVHSILDQGCHHGIMGGMCGFNINKLQKYNIDHFDIFVTHEINHNRRTIRGQDQSWLRTVLKIPISNKDVYIHINEDIISINKKKGIEFNNITIIDDILIKDCSHTITDHTSTFIGRQINVDLTEQDKKMRTNVYLPFIE